MSAPSVRARLTLWNVGVLALALIVLGLSISYGARKSLIDAVDKDLQTRAGRQVARVSQFLTAFPHGEPGLKVEGVEKGSPRLIIPGVREPVPMFQTGAGQYEAIRNPAPPPSNDPSRSPFRVRILRLDAKTSQGESAYDHEAFLDAKTGKPVFSDVPIETEANHFEPARMISIPVMHNGRVLRVIQYPTPLAGTYQALSDITGTLLLVLPLIMVAATAGGFFLTGRALKPVREITDTAAQIGAENLNERLDVKGGDEFGRLAGTFNGMLDRLKGAFTRMEHAVEQQRRFTADASHELRTPLTVIKANTSLAMKGVRTPEEYQKTLAAVNAAADSMNRLVNDLLLLARSDDGRLEVRREPVCLKPILKEAIAGVARPGVAAIELRMQDEGLEVLADGHALIRVVVNLLENAARHTPEHGSITVEQRIESDDVLVRVSDNGTGIAPEHLPHLTDRFYRADQARARQEGGNGLGLSICLSIVEAHGGTLEIESEVGQGTSVTVRLPLLGGDELHCS